MNFDGSKMRWGLGAGVIFTSPKGDKPLYVLQIHFRASNNITEYEALLHGLKLAKEIGIQRILCFGDSDLVVHQVSGEWDAKDTNMASYRFYVQQLYGFFEGCEFHHIPEQTMTRQIGYRRSAPPSRRF
jgi:ribonuclease HI